MEQQDQIRTAFGSRLIVAVLFAILAVAFITESGVMIWEFGSPLALAMAAFDSQTFVFFPIFGLIGLLAFRRAAVVLVDVYWRHIKGGKLLLIISLAAITAIASYLAIAFQSSPNRLWWEVSKQTLLDDHGEPSGCSPPDCARAPIVDAHQTVRLLARSNDGLTAFMQNCSSADLSRFRPQEERRLFCFATGSELSTRECCEARENFKSAVTALHREHPSLTFQVHRIVLPFKAFFLLMLLMIGVMLARSRKVLEENYPRAMVQVERNMPVGGLSMLLWPLMNQAYTQSFDMLYGSGDTGAFRVTAPLYTVAFAGWVMILLFYYFRRYPKETEGAAKAIGGLLAGVSILNFDLILVWVNRFFGAGISVVSIAVMLVIAAFLAWEIQLNSEAKIMPDELLDVDAL